MKKVVIKCNDSWDFNLLDEMKDWCRQNFGKNRQGCKQIWRSYYDVITYHEYHDENGGINRTYVFYFFFGEEKHATWFSLKWG